MLRQTNKARHRLTPHLVLLAVLLAVCLSEVLQELALVPHLVVSSNHLKAHSLTAALHLHQVKSILHTQALRKDHQVQVNSELLQVLQVHQVQVSMVRHQVLQRQVNSVALRVNTRLLAACKMDLSRATA
jgi:hypothetical protein